MANPENQQTELPMYTASAIGFNASTWVLRVMFGEVGDGAATPQIFRLAIGLPWPLAKVLHTYLGALIEAYETKEGTIKLPKSAEDSIPATLDQIKKQ